MNAATPLIDHYIRPRAYGRTWAASRDRCRLAPNNRRPWRGNLEWIRVISHWLKPEIRQSAGYPILLLGGVALLVSTAIGIANLGTHADIARRQLEDLQVTLQQVVPAEYYDNEPVRDTVTIQEGDRSVQVYRARRKGQVQAVSFQTTAPGYGSSRWC